VRWNWFPSPVPFHWSYMRAKRARIKHWPLPPYSMLAESQPGVAWVERVTSYRGKLGRLEWYLCWPRGCRTSLFWFVPGHLLASFHALPRDGGLHRRDGEA
jgi:hypothetical protein